MRKYSVQHPVLKKYIKFFWEIESDYMEVNNKIIPVRNIDLKFNLNDTPHFLGKAGAKHKLEAVYFSGFQEQYSNSYIIINGKVHVLGICFYPEGFYPFVNIPLSEFKNQLLGTNEISLYQFDMIHQSLKEASDSEKRLIILENELLSILNKSIETPGSFRGVFHTIQSLNNKQNISQLCEQNNIGKRRLERMFNKYLGVSAKTYFSLYRFQNSINQLFIKDYAKLSDIAYANDYFDQMHYIRDFKRFTGTTPRKFIHQNNSMLHVGKPH